MRVDPDKLDELAAEFKRLSNLIEDQETGLNKEMTKLIRETNTEYPESYVRAETREMEAILSEIRQLAMEVTEELNDKAKVMKKAAGIYREEEEEATKMLQQDVGFAFTKTLKKLSVSFSVAKKAVADMIEEILDFILGKGRNKYHEPSTNLPLDVEPLKANLTINPKVYNEQVKKLQQRLKDLGYNINVDGYFGNQTLAAVNAYKNKLGLANQDKYEGVVENQTWLYLFGRLTGELKLDPKNYSELVRLAQIRLNELGYKIEPTGYFDDKMLKVVNEFKEANQLGNTGIWEAVIGKQTWGALFSQELVAKVPSASNITGDTIEVVYYSQEDTKWKDIMYSSHNDKSQTIGSSSCGPTSMAMVISTLTGKEITPPVMCEYALKNDYRTYNDGTKRTFIEAVAKEYDITCTAVTDISKVRDALSDGKHLVVASMHKGHFTNWGHYIVISGVETKGEENWYTVLDPNIDNKSYKKDGKIDQGIENDGKVKALEKVLKSERNMFWILEKPDLSAKIRTEFPEEAKVKKPVVSKKSTTELSQNKNKNTNNTTVQITTLSENGIKFLHGSEGFSEFVYKDQAGYNTIGFGHKIKPGEKFKEPMTREEAMQLYNKDIKIYIMAVMDLQNKHNIKLTQNQFDALVSFTYNLGENIWKGDSTLRELIVSGNYTDDELKKAFGAYHHHKENGKMKDNNGLYNRRIDEAEVFLYGEYKKSYNRKI